MIAPGLSPPRADAAIAGDPTSVQALSRIGQDLKSARTLQRVVALLQEAVAAIGDGRLEAARDLALKALELDETSALSWQVLGIVFEKLSEFASALQAYEAALALAPESPAIAFDLSRLAQRLGYLELAEKLLHKTLASEPGNLDAVNNLACVLREQARFGEAIDLLREMLQIEPEHGVLWNTLGTVLSSEGRLRESVVFFDEALRLDPRFAKALYNRANVRQGLGEAKAALADIKTAIAMTRDPAELDAMRFAQSLVELQLGLLAEGFENYEVRMSPHLEDAVTFISAGERWTPRHDLDGADLLVFGEQGVGDEIIFSSILRDAQQAVGSGRLTVAVEQRLTPLYARSLPEATIVPHRTGKQGGHIYRAAELPEGHPEPTLWAPMASLFQRFRPSLDAFPSQAGFLKPDPERVAHWRDQLAALGDGLKIGFVWKSLRMDRARKRYFATFELWRKVLETPGAIFVNLQYGDVAEELEAARSLGLEIWNPPGIDLKDDLDDVAALGAALDLLIGQPNTSVSLGAATGTEWWALCTPDNWARFGAPGYPIFPQARVFTVRDFIAWDELMDDVRNALDQRLRNGG